MSIWDEEMKEVKAKKQWIYRSPLPRKRQRTTLKHQQPGKCRTLNEEEILLYKLKSYLSSFNN